MPVEKVLIARHGFRLNWLQNNWKSETGLPRDPPLAAFGVTQAEELAQYFLSLPEDQRPTAIFSSPYYRCLQTSQPSAIALNLPIYVEHGLSEWYSPVTPSTGLHPRPSAASSLHQYFPQIDDSWSPSTWYPSRKGEDVEEVHDRTEGFLKEFFPRAEAFLPTKGLKAERILLVSHAATVATLARAFVGDRELPIRVGCCSLTEVRRKNEKDVIGGWETTKIADGSHLKEGASRDWGFEDIVIANGKVVEDPGVPGTEGEVDEPVGSQRHVWEKNLVAPHAHTSNL